MAPDEEYVLTKDFAGEHERLLLLEDHVDSLSHEAFAKAMAAWVDIIGRTGTDYDWTRTFPEPLQRHGYRDVGATAIAPVFRGGTPIARFWSLTLETLRTRIVEARLLSDSEIDE